MAKNWQTYPVGQDSVLGAIHLSGLNLIRGKLVAEKFADSARQLAQNFSSKVVTKRETVTTHVETNQPTSITREIKPKVQVYYDPQVFNGQNDPDLAKTLRTKASVDKDTDSSAQAWRHKTKHRLLISKVEGRTTAAHGEITKPYFFDVITVCAPNSMGSSAVDERFFFADDDQDLQKYKAMMKLIYQRCLYAQIEKKTQVLIIPSLDFGLYSDTQKAKAIEANYQALKEAMDAVTATNAGDLKEVICVAPNSNGHNAYQADWQKAFANYSGTIPVTFTFTFNVTAVDALEVAKKLSKAQFKVGLVNAGSDRTIGGDYTTIHLDKLPPMEETLAQATNLVYVQSSDVGKQDYEYVEFPDQLCCPANLKQEGVQSPVHVRAEPETKKSLSNQEKINLASKIKEWIDSGPQYADHNIIISDKDNNGNIQFSFKTQAEAQLFATKLFLVIKIGKQNVAGLAKTPQQKNGYYVVFLAPDQIALLQQQFSFVNARPRELFPTTTYTITALDSTETNNEPVFSVESKKAFTEAALYVKFKKAFTDELKKNKQVFFLGLFCKTEMDFTVYDDMEKVRGYVKNKPNSRSAKVLFEVENQFQNSVNELKA